jgi:hypothetical protein
MRIRAKKIELILFQLGPTAYKITGKYAASPPPMVIPADVIWEEKMKWWKKKGGKMKRKKIEKMKFKG